MPEFDAIDWRQMQAELDAEFGTESVEGRMRAIDLGPREHWLTKPALSPCGHLAGETCHGCMPF